jgi:hypothetical protein
MGDDPTCSNCYDTSKYQTSDYTEIDKVCSKNDPSIVRKFYELLIEPIDSETVYVVTLRTFNERRPGRNLFNHSFIILRNGNGNNYELCDSWEGIRTFNCRKSDIFYWLKQLEVGLRNKYLSQEIIDPFMIIGFPLLLEEGEADNEYPKPAPFKNFVMEITVLN